jgi:hypothetical protein
MVITTGSEKERRRLFENHIQQRRAFYDRLGRVIVEAHEKCRRRHV